MACEEDKLDVRLLTAVTGVGTFVCLIVAFGVAALMWATKDDISNQRAATTQSPYQAQILEQKAAVDKGQQGGLSMDRAIDRIVQEG